ncbi:NAD(P)/FAD-dependent oxidoreductase [Klebsiella pneumoniae]|nr:NAD(P)/FAD-dependent oxidoreductase [Klebsiella pneumoniae]
MSDRIRRQVTSCLVNPRACHETLMPVLPANAPKRLAVVGAGPPVWLAVNAAALGSSRRPLFDALPEIGGHTSPNRSPAKRSFTRRCVTTAPCSILLGGVDSRLNTRVTTDDLLAFDETILATGIAPRLPTIDGIDHPKVLSYLDVLRDKAPAGAKVAISAAAASASTPRCF